MGLFDRFQPGIYSPMLAQMGQQPPMQGPPAVPPLTPAAQPTVPKKKGLFARFGTENEKGYSGWDGLQIAGATLRDIGNPQGQNVAQLQELMAAQQKAVQAQQQKAALDQMAAQIITDPREALLYKADPKAWADANKSRIEAYTLSKGQQRQVGGQTIGYNADTQVMGDQLVQIDPTGAQSIFRRDPTTTELETAEQNDWRRLFDQSEFDWLKKYQGGQLDVARGNLGMRGKEYNARLKGLGGFGTPGVGAISLGASLDPSEWEIQP